MTFWRLNLHTY